MPIMGDVPSTSDGGIADWPRGSDAGVKVVATQPHPGRIGSYLVLGILGQGGMGIVYKAEQSHPRRQVALKILPLGLLSSDRLIRRFEHEVEVLGRLHHPGIAQIYEAGTADGGYGLQPYFAMELVEGRSLTAYVKENNLPPQQRLSLLARICDAVHYAHQQGVIHRDLKPGNVLVDASGQPKVLDFGVARAAQSGSKWTMAETEAGQLLGTLPYMSPEQAAGDMLRMDTRSDVYALGVIAYELLVGRLPHQLDGVHLPQAIEVICNCDPPKLSTLNRSYRGDVETIVRKAIHKDKEHRYESAAELAADIRRFLNDDPITARPPTRWYQSQKFVRRHKQLVAAACAVLLATAIGGAATLWQNRTAELQLAKAAELSDVLTHLMQPSGDDGADRAIVRRIEKVQAPGDPLALANVCRAIAVAWDGLGCPTASVPCWRRVLDLRRQHLGDDKAATVDAAVGLSNALVEMRCPEEAEHHVFRARYCAQSALAKSDPTMIRADLCLANIYGQLGRFKDADAQFKAVVDRSSQTLGAEDDLTLVAKNDYACFLLESGRPSAASRLFNEVFGHYRGVKGPNSPPTLRAESALGSALLQKGDCNAAEWLLTDATKRFETLNKENTSEALSTKHNLAIALIDVGGRLREADAVANEVVQMRQALDAHDPERLRVLHTLAQCRLRRLNENDPDVPAACVVRLYRELVVSSRGYSSTAPDVTADLTILASLLIQDQLFRESLALLDLAWDGHYKLPEYELAGSVGTKP